MRDAFHKVDDGRVVKRVVLEGARCLDQSWMPPVRYSMQLAGLIRIPRNTVGRIFPGFPPDFPSDIQETEKAS